MIADPTESLLTDLRERILPRHYRKDISDRVPDDSLLFKMGPYVFLAMPFADVPPEDFGSSHAKNMVRRALTCLPVILEKGLFLVYYGAAESWRNQAKEFKVNLTALRPVILQSIHFIDPETGENLNSRTHWGPLKFGFCGPLIDDLEFHCESIRNRDGTAGS